MGTPRISVIVSTARPEPMFRWFADALARQAPDPSDIEVVLVDARLDPEREARIAGTVDGRFALRHLPPKPSPVQGPFRITRRDFFAAASARNGGIAYARAPYVVFVDDCVIPMPGWWSGIERAAWHGDVVTGAHVRRRNVVVRDGLLVESSPCPGGEDGRWHLGSDRHPVRVEGGQLYTPTFGAPRETLLAVNGFDELCDTVGQEDCHLGVRLEYAGVPVLYDRSIMVVESDERNTTGARLVREDRSLAPAAYMARLADFGVMRRHAEGNFDASHMMMDIVHGTGSPGTQGNYYWLADLAPEGFDATRKRFPSTHWFDGLPLDGL